jgi:hypothetical protein
MALARTPRRREIFCDTRHDGSRGNAAMVILTTFRIASRVRQPRNPHKPQPSTAPQQDFDAVYASYIVGTKR